MKLLLSIAIGATLFCGVSSAEPMTLQKQTIEACAWWTYEFDINGYVCRRTLPSMTVYSAPEVDKHLDRLEKMITALEERVKILEENKP